MSQLRSFSEFAISNENIISIPCTLCDLFGIYNGAGGEYLQIHDLAAKPTAGAVPLFSFYLAAAGPTPLPSIFQTLGPIKLSTGLSVAFSSTEATYTATVSTGSIQGDIEEYENPVPSDATSVGDLVTDVASLEVWANTAATQGLHTLYEVYVNNITGAVAYLQLFAHDSADGDVPLQVFKFAIGEIRTLRFGSGGLLPWQKTAAGVLRDGCYLVGSSTGPTRTITGADWRITAKYVA